MKPQNNRNNKNSKKSNLFSKWVGESNQKYSGKEMGHAFLACLGLVVLALVLTSGTRYYNYEHFINQEGGFLQDGFGYQLSMFLVYGILSIGAVLWSGVASHKNGKKLMLGAAMAGMGIAAIGVLALLAGLDFASILFYVHQANLSLGVFARMLNAYFMQYGILYVIPLILAAISFGVQAYYKNRQDETSGEHGTAAFASKQDLKAMDVYTKGKNKTLFGKDDKNQFLYHENCNRTILAQSGSGKTAGILIPALLEYPGGLFVNDMKGAEIYGVIARHRTEAFAKESAALDPYGVTRTPEFMAGKPPYLINKVYRYNPLDSISRDEYKRDMAINSLVTSLVTRTNDGGKSSHFEDLAETLLKGLIEWVLMTEEKPTLVMVYDVLNGGRGNLERILEAMQSSNYLRARAAGTQVLDAAREERGSILTTTKNQISWLADPNLRDLLSSTNFNLQDFVIGKMDIYIILPSVGSKEQGKVFRLFLAAVRNLMVQTPNSQYADEELLFIFDELGQLGYCQDIEDMLPIMRAYNGRFWAVFQDLGQIKKYGEMKGLFTGSDMLHFFGISDSDTIKWICEIGGQKTYINSSTSESKGQSGSKNSSQSKNKSVSVQESGAPLLKYNEVREMDSDQQIVIIKGKRPIKCEKVFYKKEPFFRGKFDRNPVEKNKD